MRMHSIKFKNYKYSRYLQARRFIKNQGGDMRCSQKDFTLYYVEWSN